MTRETGIGQPPTERRCAVYTRKSSEDGLELEYNSLDAQYDAAVAYIRSQAGNGWRLLEKRYDDGGFSGGNTNRPALKELLADIEAGEIDIVVVYKIDRLSRSLCDFTDLSRTFERHGVSFVSVTQQIDTSSPAGRMVLNVLMTFAQFEREMTSDRIKDKMLATRMRGMWTGGIAPYGYRIEDKRLVPDPQGAEAVRFVFRRYAETGSPKTVAAEVSRQFGPRGDGSAWNTANVYRMLRNSIYAGMMPHKRTGQTFKGRHEAIVDAGLWEDCQRIMDEASSLKPAERRESTAILKGLLTSGHASERDWQIVYNQDRGRIVHTKDARLQAVEPGGKARHDLKGASVRAYLGAGNCLIGHVDSRTCMATAWIHAAGVEQFAGYTVPSWYGFMGWGVSGLFGSGRYSLPEARYLTNERLVWARLRGHPASEDKGLDYDRDVFAFYGDPAQRIAFPDDTTPYRVAVKGDRVGVRFTRDCDFAPLDYVKGAIPVVELFDSPPPGDALFGPDGRPVPDSVVTERFVFIPMPGRHAAGETHVFTIGNAPSAEREPNGG